MGNETMTSAAYGNLPIATGAGTKSFTHNAYAMKVNEATVISAFKDSAGTTVATGWENITIDAGEYIFFGRTDIKSIVVTSGGKGCYFLSGTDL